MTDKVGRRVPKGYYIRIEKGTSKQQIKQMLFTRCDDPDYYYDDTVTSVFNTIHKRDRDAVVRNRGGGYDWWEGMDLTGFKEFFYDDIGDW